MGRRQWWLQQLVAAVPPAHWSGLWKIAPADCVSATMGEFAEVVLTAWHLAALRHPDRRWVAALMLAAAKESRGPLTLELLNLLPDDVRDAITAEVIESPRVDGTALMQLLKASKFSFDRQSAAALFRAIDRQVEQQSNLYYVVSSVLQDAALRVPPTFYDELTSRYATEKYIPYRNATDEFFQTLLIRRDIQREFST